MLTWIGTPRNTRYNPNIPVKDGGQNMNRQQWIEECAEYGVDVTDEYASFPSGRYHGESPIVLLLESWSMDGFGDPVYGECDCDDAPECDCETDWEGDVFEIDDDTRAEFPEFGDATFATFYRSEQGFCYARLLTEDPRPTY